MWAAMFVSLWLAGKETFINLPICANNLDLYFPKKTSLYSTCNIAESDIKVVRKEGDSLTHFDIEVCYCTDRQKLSSLSTTVLYRTILTQMIIFHLLMKWLLGSGDRWHGPEIWRQSSQKAPTIDRKRGKNFDSDSPFLSSETTSVHFCVLLTAK